MLENIQAATKEKDDRVKKVLADCAGELKEYAEEIKNQKLVRDKYEDVIQVMKEIIDKQTAEIDRLKKERLDVKSGQGTLRVKKDKELLESHLLNKKQKKPRLLSPAISLLPRAFTRSPVTIASQSSSSSSESRSVRQFPLLDDLMQDSDSEDEAEKEDNSPGLGVDFSELIAITDSEEEEEVMMIEE